MSVLDEAPFPFHKPMGQQLWRVIAGMYPVPMNAIALAERFEVDPLELPQGLSPRQLWHVMLEMTAIKGTTRDMVTAVRDDHPRSPHLSFLSALVGDKPFPVSPEPVADFDATVTKPEALIFTDDLTMPVGLVPNLIATLHQLHALAPAVCLLRVESPLGSFFGTGFKIGSDLVLTNEHVLFPERQKATLVRAEFMFDVDTTGASLPVVDLVGDVGSIDGARENDWAVIRVPNMKPAWPTIEVANAPVPTNGERAYILQHPAGQKKRLGFVRNTITAVTDQYVQYLTDTQPGSSGAPVFDSNGGLIALHHRGGTPVQVPGAVPLTKNQGVRISVVAAALKARGLLS